MFLCAQGGSEVGGKNRAGTWKNGHVTNVIYAYLQEDGALATVNLDQSTRKPSRAWPVEIVGCRLYNGWNTFRQLHELKDGQPVATSAGHSDVLISNTNFVLYIKMQHQLLT